jgi:LCP family protein required for cell wall assembly
MSRRRHLFRRWLGALSLLSLVGLTGGGLALAQNPPVAELHKMDEGHFAPVPGQPVFILALGIDGRAGVGGERSDAIHLIGINPGTGSATILDIPRDTYVGIPGHGQDKINAAYTSGEEGLAAQTVEALTGVHAQFVLTTTFDGFPKMVDEIGGLPINVPYPMHDGFSGSHFDPGLHYFGGLDAFSFVRDRHSTPNGDLDRTVNQGAAIIAALAMLRSQGASGNPAKIMKALATLGRNTRLKDVGVLDLYNLGRLALSIDPAKVRNVGMPASLGNIGAESVVFVAPGAGSLFDDFRDDAVLESH